MYVCVQRDVCRGVWIEPDKCESMLYMEGQVWYMEGVYAWRVGVDPVCVEGWTRINPGCSKTKQPSQDSAGEGRKDGIRR